MTPDWYVPWLRARTDAELLGILRADREWVRRGRRDGVYPYRVHRQEVRLAVKECRRRGISTRLARPT